MSDTEAAESWRPAASWTMMRRRARMYADIRSFFAQRGMLEVDTPILSGAMNPDHQIESLSVNTSDMPRYLHTSPEFAMKRLLAAGSGPIWQLCRVFRKGESGRRHNPEFTMLEWYQPGYSEQDLMQEVADLIQQLHAQPVPVAFVAYRQAFRQYAGFDPLAGDLKVLRQATRERFDWSDEDREPMLDLWLAEVVEPALPHDSLTFIHDWPASKAALARIAPDPEDGQPIARRFELFWQGMELANGYYELTDAAEQAQRFEAEQRRRVRHRLHVAPLDRYLDQAMQAGLPETAGVALGVDRLLMALTGTRDIREVLAFPADRA
ncbi:EF-P lysine aminoacylase GenX [Natronospirillum operosum]|uniref:EF-P lysine aminoacylase GenX n=1 Tax=Natronospirillum operosum TaxID=2759953 RepID=A0A4Z0WA24_9GAMM|nr:EF-P lysine aminoacylase EpmA [Natronospirillum operosum]TGG94059.1 EF-P lysine aminoacylase GenX [Natronospirillum operosum]